MSLLGRFQAIEEKDKAAVVRKLMESGTPNFDFFYLTGLAVIMATFGLLINSPAIVIGSMLIAPILYPILGLSLGIVMSNPTVIRRAFLTLIQSSLSGVALAAIATLLFASTSEPTAEILARTEPSLVFFLVGVTAGLAVSYVLAQPEWSETLPGIAISVALIPPLSTVGIGVAWLNLEIITGALVLLGINAFGIIVAAMLSFSLMNLYQKQNIAKSTIKRANEKMKEEAEAIEEVDRLAEEEAKEYTT